MTRLWAGDVSRLLGGKLPHTMNAGMLVSKFADVASGREAVQAKKRNIEALVRSRIEELGLEARRGFSETLSKARPGSVAMIARLKSRLMINQGGGIQENAGLCIDRHFGFPYIPGSAIKGITRAAARELGAAPPEMVAVFGADRADGASATGAARDSLAGAVVFLPAYPCSEAPLVIDLINCHHPAYYQAGGGKKALDNEDPIPNIFPAVEAGACFCFILAPVFDKERWKRMAGELGLPTRFDPLQTAEKWLDHGISQLGIGAKTSAGYGWFERDLETEAMEREKLIELQRLQKLTARREEEKRAAELAELRRLSALSPEERAREQQLSFSDEEFAHFATALSYKEPHEQRAFFILLRGEKKQRWKVWKKRKPELAEAIGRVAAGMGEVLP